MSSENNSIYLGLSDTQNVACLQFLLLTGLSISGPVAELHRRELDRKEKTVDRKERKRLSFHKLKLLRTGWV